jgi:hypothetical protein
MVYLNGPFFPLASENKMRANRSELVRLAVGQVESSIRGA